MLPNMTKAISLAPVIPDIAIVHDLACRYVEERYALKGGIAATWVIASGANVAFIETEFEDDGPSKDLAAYVMRNVLARYKCQAYSFISEVWQASFKNDEERKMWMKHAEYRGVSSLPPEMRDDVAMVLSHDRSGGHMLAKYLVTLREPGKGLNFLGPRMDESAEFRGFAGRMSNLFEAEKPIED